MFELIQGIGIHNLRDESSPSPQTRTPNVHPVAKDTHKSHLPRAQARPVAHKTCTSVSRKLHAESDPPPTRWWCLLCTRVRPAVAVRVVRGAGAVPYVGNVENGAQRVCIFYFFCYHQNLPPLAPGPPPELPARTTCPEPVGQQAVLVALLSLWPQSKHFVFWRSSEQVLHSPLSSFTGYGQDRAGDQTARATAPLARGDANVRGVDPTFAHHVTQPLASLRAAAPPLQPAVLLWPHRPTQLLASWLVTPVLGVPTNNDAAHAALRRGLLDPPAPTAAPARAFMRLPAPPTAPPPGEPPVTTGVLAGAVAAADASAAPWARRGRVRLRGARGEGTIQDGDKTDVLDTPVAGGA